jgi:hypothetical protein
VELDRKFRVARPCNRGQIVTPHLHETEGIRTTPSTQISSGLTTYPSRSAPLRSLRSSVTRRHPTRAARARYSVSYVLAKPSSFAIRHAVSPSLRGFRTRMADRSNDSIDRRACSSETSRRQAASWSAERTSDHRSGGAMRSSRKMSKPAGDPLAGKATLASITSMSAAASGTMDQAHPIRLRLTGPGLLPGFRKRQRTIFRKRLFEVGFFDQMLSPDLASM